MSLRFIALSGTISVTENLYIYETDSEMIIVDCGVGFPDIEMRGVDLVIPDFSYVIKNKHKLKGIVVSQGHEDHIGAIPFLLRELSTEIWAAPLVTAFLEDKFQDHKVTGVKINTFNPEKDSFDVGGFKIHAFRVTHSVPDSCGFAIDTPEGRVFHVPEHKMDQDPVDEMPFGIQRAKDLASGNNLFLASDCLGANKPGITKGERHIEENIRKIVGSARKAVFFTAISSNIGRFQQAINVAMSSGRKAVFVGRSVQKKCEMAHDLGYLKYPKGAVVELRESRHLPDNKVMYLIAGCYGQVGSSLYKLSINEHNRIKVNEGDTLVFSADPAPPYTKESENFVIDNLIDMGVDVHYYDLHEGLYISGHGSQEDIKELFKIVKPKYFIPIGGAIRFMHSYRNLAVEFGAKRNQVFNLKPGENIIFENGNARLGQKIPTKNVLVDGLGIGDVGKVVLQDRRDLSQGGVVVAILKVNRRTESLVDSPRIVSKGFIFEKQRKDLLINASGGLTKYLKRKGKLKRKDLETEAGDYLESYFYQKTARRPMVLPVIVEV